MEAKAPLPRGTQVKVIKEHKEGEDRIRVGQTFTVQVHVPKGDSNHDWDEIDTGFYWLEGDDGYGEYSIPDTHIEQVRTPEEFKEMMKTRTVPSVGDVLGFLGSELLGDADTFDIDETNRDTAEQTIELYGTTDKGLRFAVEVKVTAIYEIDA